MLVEDVGPISAKIMLVGEAPGKEEEAKGFPFVGPSGRLLKQMLSHSGIDYKQCYVTNISNERPPGNKFDYFYEDKCRKVPSTRLSMFQHRLRQKIDWMKPNIVIALGAEALRAITNKRGIEDWRGSLLTYNGVKVMPTYHPAAVMRRYTFHPIVEMDFAKASKESEFRELRTPEVAFTIGPTAQQVLTWFSNIKDYPRISFDIETIGKHVRCIGFAKGSNSGMKSLVVPFIRFPSSDMTLIKSKTGSAVIQVGGSSSDTTSYWSKNDELIVLDRIAEVLNDKSIQKVGQNSISFDAPILKDEFGLHIDNHFMDTMHAWHVLYPELPMGLSFLCSILTDYSNYWSDKVTEDDTSEWTYCAMDAAVTLAISYKIHEELHTSNLWSFYKDHIHELAFALSYAQETGVLIDQDVRKKLRDDKEIVLAQIKKDIDELTGKDLNPNSHVQVKQLLYEDMKFPKIYIKKKLSVNEEALRALEKRYPNEPVLEKIVSYRKTKTLISTFLKSKLDERGRMKTSYNASGTESGRISSSKTLWGTGMNLQNIPVGKARGVENIRNIFIAGDNKIFVKGDLSQAETRVVAEILHRLGDTTLSDKYAVSGFDIHAWMASQISREGVKFAAGRSRSVGKLSNHSGNYMAGPRVLMARALKDGIEGIDFQVAQSVLRARHKAIPGLKIWWKDVEKKIRQTRTITTCLGRRRIFFGRMDETTLRDAVAFEPQSTVADVCNTIFRRLYDTFRGTQSNVLLQVHDEVVVECRESEVHEVVNQIRKAAIVPLFINKKPLLIPIDISVGKNWKDCKPYG